MRNVKRFKNRRQAEQHKAKTVFAISLQNLNTMYAFGKLNFSEYIFLLNSLAYGSIDTEANAINVNLTALI